MAYTSHEGQSLQVESTFLTLVSGGDFRSGAPGNDQFLLSGTRVSRDATPSAAGNDCNHGPQKGSSFKRSKCTEMGARQNADVQQMVHNTDMQRPG